MISICYREKPLNNLRWLALGQLVPLVAGSSCFLAVAVTETVAVVEVVALVVLIGSAVAGTAMAVVAVVGVALAAFVLAVGDWNSWGLFPGMVQ